MFFSDLSHGITRPGDFLSQSIWILCWWTSLLCIWGELARGMSVTLVVGFGHRWQIFFFFFPPCIGCNMRAHREIQCLPYAVVMTCLVFSGNFVVLLNNIFYSKIFKNMIISNNLILKPFLYHYLFCFLLRWIHLKVKSNWIFMSKPCVYFI